MSFSLPPVVKQAETVRAEIERAVRRWTRDNRFGHGVELRRQAKEVVKAAHMAWRDRSNLAARLDKLVEEVDSLKLDLQLAQQIHAFNSFAQFEAIFRLARNLGQQVGGWRKQQHSKRQNPPAEQHALAERAQILSTRGASPEARR